ncbi:molybdopterin molybdenumtransferase MoeA [Nocardiopsis terrae]|uniref:Molybdopterin molybdenumtransferase n=1 Tax=Nocardiopsis terrae TaxID=372655 RepID=A0ABR9HDU2_9ACTN|nr:molybdopterin molybdotransferase MoeA [Nocardiopsis terrae]MBE1457197.1 molybdopterin molybdotransferase [Nocardiopsis terrae]GHC91097.1 molybdopterin molybdenumtransferase MoeA [Nocardiopsis terrae]
MDIPVADGSACGGHRGATSWARARERARRLGEELRSPVRDLPLERALGGVLAADLRALVGSPAFDASAMDGFAVAGEGPWTPVGTQLAGTPVAGLCLAEGEAVEIATGARVPKGTEAVLPYELAGTADGRVRGEAHRGRHVRWAGEETAPGETVLEAGTEVAPAVLGLAASLGHDSLPVRLPTVSVLVTGDEIATGGLPGEGVVRDAIGPLMPGLVAWAGGHLESSRVLGDGYRDLDEALTAGGTDVVVVCGSSSKGPADHLRGVLREAGAQPVVDGVACRPGHPQLLARSGNTAFVGLPGNPNAALVASLTLLVPLLCAMSGRTDPARATGTVPLSGEVRSRPEDTRLVAVRLREGRAEPVGHDRPGSLRGAALAEAYAVVPPGWAGTEVELLRLP